MSDGFFNGPSGVRPVGGGTAPWARRSSVPDDGERVFSRGPEVIEAYSIPLPVGEYQLAVWIPLAVIPDEAPRSIDVGVDGVWYLRDVTALTNAESVTRKVVGTIDITDGRLKLQLRATQGKAAISGVEIVKIE